MNEDELTKKDIDDYNKRRQEEYDEATKGNEEIRKKQEEEKKKKGLLDEGSAFRQTAALGTEVAANTLLDLFSFVPPAQVAGGSAINYFAQKIRGGEISQGEIVASGLASLIPGGAQGTALARTAKGIGKGALSGAIETTGMTTIDEGRLPTAQELGTGAGIGGAFGGLFTTAANTQQIQELTKRVKGSISNLSDEFMTPFNVARGDLIGAARFGGTSGGVKMSPTIGGSGGSGDNPLSGNEFTQKFIKQPWEQFQSRYPGTLASGNKMLTQLTGFGTKLNAPQPKGASYQLIRSQGRGNQPKSIIKDDIDLTNRKDFKFDTPEQAQESANKFKRRIIRLMQIDRIRGEDAGTQAGITSNPSKVKAVAGNLEDIGKTYYDYLTGYFNRYIRRGTVDNFKEAVKLKIPKIKKGQLQPELDTVQGNVSLVRELRLFTMAPDVYESGAFKVKSPSYQGKLKTLIRKYSSVDAPKTYNERRNIFEYRFDAHHIDQVAEGWPLYRGLPKAEIPKMRELIRSFGLEPGNHDDNVLLLLNKFHKDYHNIYWPKSYAKLKVEGDGWDIDVIRSKQTASERYEYARRYVEAITESRDEVIDAINRNLDELAAKKNKTRAQLTEAEVNKISIDLEDIGDEVPADIAAQMAEDAGINDVTRWRDYEN